MDQKPITLIVSDLHIGDGKAGDDFVYDKCQFVKFLRNQAATPEGRKGEIELIINGDFLEFVQVNPGAYNYTTKKYWCSEAESVAKLDSILLGHPDIFKALREFQVAEDGKQNRVTLFAGNHDVDLYWDDVQTKLRAEAGNLNIELKHAWYQRHNNRLWISHGHLFPEIDPVNGFKQWREPRMWVTQTERRLEMCPGTLFVVKFVNLLEAQYPFADNLHPETALAGILWREDKWGLKTVAWMLTRFAARFPSEMLSTDETAPDIGTNVRDAIKYDRDVREQVAALYRDILKVDMTANKVRETLNTDDALADFIEQLMASSALWDSWLKVLNQTKPGTLGGDGGGGTLAIRNAGKIDVRNECLKQARSTWKAGAQIVVLGHTHLPDAIEENGKRYYNPGSWTRYVETNKVATLTLEDLRDEKKYPYRLHCVRVEDTGAERLRSEFLSIDDDGVAHTPFGASV